MAISNFSSLNQQTLCHSLKHWFSTFGERGRTQMYTPRLTQLQKPETKSRSIFMFFSPTVITDFFLTPIQLKQHVAIKFCRGKKYKCREFMLNQSNRLGVGLKTAVLSIHNLTPFFDIAGVWTSSKQIEMLFSLRCS